jgi:integrase
MHSLRHFYASVLIEAGESVRVVAEYLGHADPGFTLRVYAHLFPAAHVRSCLAIDQALGPTWDTADAKDSLADPP